MDSSIYQDTIEYVNDSFKGKNVKHFERTVYWIEQWLGNCTDAHRVAAYGHDIERAFRSGDMPRKGYLDPEFLQEHQQKGSLLMKQFCLDQGESLEFSDHVAHLIEKHEEGGDYEQNMLRDADSVSFMETNVALFVEVKSGLDGYKKVKEKIDWMFERIGSDQAQEIASPLYKKATGQLESIRNSVPK